MATFNELNLGTEGDDSTGDTLYVGGGKIKAALTAINTELTNTTSEQQVANSAIVTLQTRVATLEAAMAADGWSFLNILTKTAADAAAPAAPTGITFTDAGGFAGITAPWSEDYPTLAAGEKLYAVRLSADPDNTVTVGSVVHVLTAPEANSGGSTPPPAQSSHTAHLFWQANNGLPSAIPTDAASGTATTTQTLIIPASENNGYIIIAQPTAEADITSLTIGGINQIAAFTKAGSTFTADSVEYEYWISNTVLLQSVVAGNAVVIGRD